MGAPVETPLHATGGHFSCSYRVENEVGEVAFLKAIDYSAALESPDPARALEQLTAAFNFERDVVKACAGHRLSRVVRAIDSGSLTVDGFPIPQVSYPIFELGDGDIRKYREVAGYVDIVWALRTLHSASIGVRQLHDKGIAHQDLKPSNLMTFGDEKCKLGDFGRASLRGSSSPHDALLVPGDISYAPPELMYGHLLDDWDRRRACDLYLLGSLVLFQFAEIGATAAIFRLSRHRCR